MCWNLNGCNFKDKIDMLDCLTCISMQIPQGLSFVFCDEISAGKDCFCILIHFVPDNTDLNSSQCKVREKKD